MANIRRVFYENSQENIFHCESAERGMQRFILQLS